MAKTKKKTRGSRGKFKELRDQVDGLGEEVCEIESEFPYFNCGSLNICYPGRDASNKHRREYRDSLQDNSITKPPGTAGKGRGLGYNLRNAMGLSGSENEQIYLSLLVSPLE
jgi:hypothetical protein